VIFLIGFILAESVEPVDALATPLALAVLL
jgi:hypothetical protein